jgi:uncharacterized protein YjbI with pentapeptide repeats
MGTGAYMKITNNRSIAVTVTVTDISCMYDNDTHGSNLSLFNNATIQAGEALPSGNPQYIESNNSGECAFGETNFYLTFKDPAGNVIGSKFNLSESDLAWQTWNNVDENFFSAAVTPSGNQFQIVIDVLVDPFPAGPVVNQWILSSQSRAADIWYNQDFTVYGLNAAAGMPAPGSANLVSLHDQGNGTLALECGQSYNAYASVRDDYNYQVGFQFVNYPDHAGWITQVRDNEILQAIPTGDGYFALYSPQFKRYLQVNPQRNSVAKCNALMATGTDLASAGRFSAAGQQRNSVLDLVQISKSAAGLSFAGVDLTGQDLSGANLTGCDFTKAVSAGAGTFTGATLTNAKFGAVTLDLVKLAGADCTGADFTGATLTASATPAPMPVLAGAILKNAQLQGTLAGANLTGATLDGATLTSSLAGATLTKASLAGTTISGTADLTAADLTGAVLTGATLAGNLSSANLTGAVLNSAVAQGGDLSDANLTGASLARVNLGGQPALKLTGANLTGVDLSVAILPGANLSGTNLTGTDFTGQNLSQVKFSSQLQQSTDPDHPTIFAKCTLPFTVIGLNWSCLDLTGTDITGVPTDLTGLNASGVRRPQANFAGATLDGANFAGASLDGAQFTGASLRGQVNFRGALLVSAVFTHAVLDQASFQAAALGGVKASQAADFSSAFVSNCDFAQASLYGVIFTGATLVSGNILEASAPGLQEANFTNAYLPDADFTGASLQGAKFDGAFMVGCVLSNADLSPAEQGAVSASLDGACLQGAALDGANLAGANLDNAAITDARGMIMQQYYGEDGQLTPSAEMRYQASDFPVAASFSDETVCPNGDTYAVNVDASLTIAQMMVASHPPTSWAPRDLGRKAEGQRTKQSNRNITDHG